MEDAELLQSYAKDRSEAAFSELVRRHIDFVFATAQRKLGGDSHRAKDVVQLVFAELARKSAALSGQRVLAGWLYIVTRNTVAGVVRSERRRARREQESQAMEELTRNPTPPAEWERMRPAIDKALSVLAPRDREAVILRFFEHRLYPEIGARLSVSADAARLRVERALEKMRPTFSRHGVSSTAGAIAAILTTESAVCAPAGLAASVAGSAMALSASAALGSSGVGSLIYLMSTNKAATALFSLVFLAGGGGAILQERANAKISEEATALRTQVGDYSAVDRENRLLAGTLAEQNRLAEANRIAATLVTSVPSLRKRIADLQAALAARETQEKGRNGPPSLSAATQQALLKLQPLINAKDWDGVIALLGGIVKAVPPDSYDRLIAEDLLGKSQWQYKGDEGLASALSDFEQLNEVLKQHPDYFSPQETLDHQEYAFQINYLLAYKASGLLLAPGMPTPVINSDYSAPITNGKVVSEIGAPDQWFPQAIK